MSEAELQAIVDEVAPAPEPVAAPEPVSEPAPEPEPAPAIPVVTDFRVVMVTLFRQLWAVAGAVVCVRANVSELTAAELDALAAAAAEVAMQYDLAKLDSKAAAWLALGVTVGAVAVPRVEEVRRVVPFVSAESAKADSEAS